MAIIKQSCVFELIYYYEAGIFGSHSYAVSCAVAKVFFLGFLMRFYCILKNWNGSRANHEEEKSIVYDALCSYAVAAPQLL